MPFTFSILNGENIESTRKYDIYSVLQDLADNTQKEISPKDIRDAFFTTWSNIAFKLTYSSTGSEYIGIDSNNPDDRDVKKKILIGKRSYNGLDIINDSIIDSSDTDIFFYNTKDDSLSQDSTKISILAGTDSSLFKDAPFIESKKVSDKVELNIENPTYSINIKSNNDTVSINNILFPSISDTQNNAIDGKILKYSGVYPYGSLIWDDPVVNSIEIGTTSSTTNIYGTVSLNGHLLEFVEDKLVPNDIGGIEQGMSFSVNSFSGSNWPLVEVIRKLLYPYVEPELSLDIYNIETSNKYAEVGKTFSIFFTYSVITYARDADEQVSMYFIRDNGGSTASWTVLAGGYELAGLPGTVFSFTYSKPNNFNNNIGEEIKFSFEVSNVNPNTILQPLSNLDGFSFSRNDKITIVSPIFSGFSINEHNFDEAGLLNLFNDGDIDKIIEPYPGVSNSIDKEIYSEDYGYIYFAYPYSYPELNLIKDPNGFIIHDQNDNSLSGFTFSGEITENTIFSHYDSYRIYRTKNKIIYNGTGEFKFEF